MEEQTPSRSNVSWGEVKDAASLVFNIWVGQPELAWAQRAWQILNEAKLTTYSSELERYEVLFRLLVLGGIYSDFCDAAWEYYEPAYFSWAEPLELESFFLGQLYSRLPEWKPGNGEAAYEALDVLVENQRDRVVVALMSALGGASGLYGSLWRSRHADGAEPEDDDTYDAEVSQQAAYSWVDQGCGRYR